jgi:hypothetical protein
LPHDYRNVTIRIGGDGREEQVHRQGLKRALRRPGAELVRFDDLGRAGAGGPAVGLDLVPADDLLLVLLVVDFDGAGDRVRTVEELAVALVAPVDLGRDATIEDLEVSRIRAVACR